MRGRHQEEQQADEDHGLQAALLEALVPSMQALWDAPRDPVPRHEAREAEADHPRTHTSDQAQGEGQPSGPGQGRGQDEQDPRDEERLEQREREDVERIAPAPEVAKEAGRTVRVLKQIEEYLQTARTMSREYAPEAPSWSYSPLDTGYVR